MPDNPNAQWQPSNPRSLAKRFRSLGWIGLWTQLVLLAIPLANPQTGIQIAPGPGGDPLRSLSAIDAVSLMSLLVILSAELMVLSFTLWLLFRTTRPSPAETENTA